MYILLIALNQKPAFTQSETKSRYVVHDAESVSFEEPRKSSERHFLS